MIDIGGKDRRVRWKSWPLTREASREFGRVMATLKRSGTMIGPMDVLIAAIALTLPECVVSKDTGRRMPG
jgi:predicted nucleic acid-binding protein